MRRSIFSPDEFDFPVLQSVNNMMFKIQLIDEKIFKAEINLRMIFKIVT